MLLLCTNDDGILARGLECLERSARPLGDVQQMQFRIFLPF